MLIGVPENNSDL